MTEFNSKYTLKSIPDNSCFEVDQKIISFSTLLQDLCNLTEVKDVIGIDCSREALDIFIKLITPYETVNDVHNIEYEKQFFEGFSDDRLASIARDLCILDSDFILDILADVILDRMKLLDWKEMIEYLSVEDDYSEVERRWIDSHQLEYFISLKTESSPLTPSSQSFYSLKSKFETPMNVLLARICQRSNEVLAFNLALTCKTLKEENDRHPIKPTSFALTTTYWKLEVIKEYPSKTHRGSAFKTLLQGILEPPKYNEAYFAAIIDRKVTILYNEANEMYVTFRYPWVDILLPYMAMDFIVPQQKNDCRRICFKGSLETIYLFDILKCPYTYLCLDFYECNKNGIDFEKVYQFIAKDFSKEIEIISADFKFLGSSRVRFYKKPNAFKFSWCSFHTNLKPEKHFKKFIERYMELEGHIRFPFYNAHTYTYIPEMFIQTYDDNKRLCFCTCENYLKTFD